MGKLELVPISLKEANKFVEMHHRHHKPVTGHKFSVAAAVDGEVVGVAIVGRPVSRYMDDGWTLEVNRLCTDGTRNACSFLYSACWRCAKNMGYKKTNYLHSGHGKRRFFESEWVEMRWRSRRETLDGKTKTRS